MIGMNATTGLAVADLEHLAQSIADILWTPIGSRVMRRDYGSRIPDLIDAPATPARRLTVLAAAADALRRWEPRLALTRLDLAAADGTGAAGGRFDLLLEGALVPEDGARPLPVSLAVPLVAGAPVSTQEYRLQGSAT